MPWGVSMAPGFRSAGQTPEIHFAFSDTLSEVLSWAFAAPLMVVCRVTV